jgi:hypothetical protein
VSRSIEQLGVTARKGTTMDMQALRRAQIDAGENAVIADLQRKGLVPSDETPGDRYEREKFEDALQRKARWLRGLEPLGFVDNDDGECPGAIYHPGAGVTLDIATLRNPADVVHELLKIGSERGVAALRRDLRAAIGL